VKKPRLKRIWKTIALLVVCLVLPISPKAQDSTFTPKYFAVSGFHINQGLTYGLFGIATQLSNKLAIFTAADFGGYSQAYSSISIYYIPLSTRLTLGAILGPQIEIIDPNPDYETAITYFTGATGLILIQKINTSSGIWAGFRYLFANERVKPLKFGAGLLVKL
jgi:hypothetical protein